MLARLGNEDVKNAVEVVEKHPASFAQTLFPRRQ